MNKENFNEFRTVLLGIGEMYDKPISKSLGELWWQLMTDISIEEFKHAVSAHMNDPDQGMFMPKPANIIKQVSGTEKQQVQNLTTQAELAWQAVEGEIRRTGSYGSPRINDGLALAAIKALGGWSHICSTTTDKMTWMRKEFIASYQNYSTTPVELLPESLPGRIEIENAKKNGTGQGMKVLGELMSKVQIGKEK